MKPVSGLAAPFAISSTSACSRASMVILGNVSARFLRAWMSFSGTIRSISFPPCGSTSLDILALGPFRTLLVRTLDLRLSANGEVMKPAFLLLPPAPAAGARVFSGHDGGGARPASDRRVVLIVEGVVRHVVFVDVGPDVARGPTDQRVDLDEAELAVALDDRGVGPIERLVAAD